MNNFFYIIAASNLRREYLKWSAKEWGCMRLSEGWDSYWSSW